MDGEDTSIGMMDGVTFNEGIVHRAIQMEMDRVTTQDSRLSNISEFSVTDPSNCSRGALTVDHHVRTIL